MDANTEKKPYEKPELTVLGDIQKITGWIGLPFGEFLGGPDWASYDGGGGAGS